MAPSDHSPLRDQGFVVDGDQLFVWGTAQSSVSAEGVAPAADWSAWERDGRAPRSGDGAGFAVDFRDDLERLAGLGLDHLRLTVEWARVEPSAGRVDSDALDAYRDILAHARQVGVRCWLTLHHTALPGWYLDDEGGHRDEIARQRFWLPHVDRVAETFDDLSSGWTPIEDPIGWAVRGYGLGSRPPGRRDPEAMHTALFGAMLAQHDACRLLVSGRQPVMPTFRADPVHALPEGDGRITPEAQVAAGRWDDVLWTTWLRAAAEGSLVVPGRAAAEVPTFVDGIDLIGLVHDHPVGVRADGSLGSWPAGARLDASGFSPEPEELGVAIERAADALPDHTLVVAAHGVPTDDDDWRDTILDATLGIVDQAGDELGLRGYFHESAIDGYEWSLGFAGGRGLIDRERNVKPSAARLSAAAQPNR